MDLIKDRIILARTSLIMRKPFYGQIALRMKLKENSDIQTAAVDGTHLLYNPEFIASLDDDELLFVIGHEVNHLVYDHLGRRGNASSMRWNIAADFVDNRDLVQQKVGKMPESALYDEKYDNMCVEEVYASLGDESPGTLSGYADRLLDDHDLFDELPEMEKQHVRDTIREAVLSAAASCSKEDIPADIQRMIDELNTPQVDWKAIIRSTIEGLFKTDTSYYRPNRKMMSSGFILPGNIKAPSVQLDIASDTSGSIGSELWITFMSEVAGIVQQYTDYNVRMMSWHTRVCDVVEYDPYSVEDIVTYKATQSGGTDPECVFKYIEENETPANMTIIFTDGEFHLGRDTFSKEVLWVVVDNPSFTTPFGLVLHIDSKKY